MTARVYLGRDFKGDKRELADVLWDSDTPQATSPQGMRKRRLGRVFYRLPRRHAEVHAP